jgi:hypothetical protein
MEGGRGQGEGAVVMGVADVLPATQGSHYRIEDADGRRWYACDLLSLRGEPVPVRGGSRSW